MSAPSQRQGQAATTKMNIYTHSWLTQMTAACYQWQLPSILLLEIKSTHLLHASWWHQFIIELLLLSSTLLKTTLHMPKTYKMPSCPQLPLTDVPHGSLLCGLSCWNKLKNKTFWLQVCLWWSLPCDFDTNYPWIQLWANQASRTHLSSFLNLLALCWTYGLRPAVHLFVEKPAADLRDLRLQLDYVTGSSLCLLLDDPIANNTFNDSCCFCLFSISLLSLGSPPLLLQTDLFLTQPPSIMRPALIREPHPLATIISPGMRTWHWRISLFFWDHELYIGPHSACSHRPQLSRRTVCRLKQIYTKI